MATTTLQTNELNDLFLPDGRNLVLISGEDACVQNIQQAVLMRLTEDIYDQNKGVDYLGAIFSPQVDYDAARKSISSAILGCPDVISIDSLIITIDGDVFNYVAQIITIYGPLPVSN
jgi:hypothetical protein